MKNKLRQLIRQKRASCSHEKRNQDSYIIRKKLLALKQWSDASIIGCYVALEDEVQTQNLIQVALATHKQIAVPVVSSDSPDMHFQAIHSLEQLSPGPWGILQPKMIAPVIQFTANDLLVIPGVAFDHHGNRLGQGKGFYDRYLTHCPAYRVGMAFDFQIVPTVPTSPTDIPMDVIITESHTVVPA